MTKQEILTAQYIGYWSELGGVELKGMSDDQEEAYVVSNAWYGTNTAHRVKVYMTSRPHIRIFGHKLYFDECIRR